MDSVGGTVGLSHNLLQDFIAFFGDALIECSGARHWAAYTFLHRSPEKIDKKLSVLLKEYATDLASTAPGSWVSGCSEIAQQIPDAAQSQALAAATNLIRHYRPRIAQYFQDNAVSEPLSAKSLEARRKDLSHQLSLTERFGLFTKSESNPRDSTQADNVMECNEEESKILIGLGPVRDWLVLSDAFHRLAVSLRRTLYQNDGAEMGRVQTALLEGKRKPLHKVRFDVNWTLTEFMLFQYGREFPSLGSVIVLVGSALYAQATTCADYVKTTWPRTGLFLIELLDATLRASKPAPAGTAPREIKRNCNYLPLSVNITLIRDDELIFAAHGTDEMLIVELAQQIAWIGSAMNTSPFGDQLHTRGHRFK
jgi:hypothetical protein